MNTTSFIDNFLEFLDTGQIFSTKIKKESLNLITELIHVKSIDLRLVDLIQNITFPELINNIFSKPEETSKLFENTQFPYSNFIENYPICLDKIPSLGGKHAYI